MKFKYEKIKCNVVIVMTICSILIGFTIATLIKTSIRNGYEVTLVPISKIMQASNLLEEVKKEKNLALKELLYVENQIKELELKKSSQNQTMKKMMEETNKYEMLGGLVDVKGPGVAITIERPPVESNLILADHDEGITKDIMLPLLNKLKDAGAEAISINGQRVLRSTAIGDDLSVNLVATAFPYKIEVIGNPDEIEKAINIRYGIIDELRNYLNLKVTVTKKEEVFILRNSKNIEFKFAHPYFEE